MRSSSPAFCAAARERRGHGAIHTRRPPGTSTSATCATKRSSCSARPLCREARRPIGGLVMTSVTPAGRSASASPTSSVRRDAGCREVLFAHRERARLQIAAAKRPVRARGAPAPTSSPPEPTNGSHTTSSGARRRRRAPAPRRRWGATPRARRPGATRSGDRRARAGRATRRRSAGWCSTRTSQSDAVGSLTSSGARRDAAARRPRRCALVPALRPGDAVAHRRPRVHVAKTARAASLVTARATASSHRARRRAPTRSPEGSRNASIVRAAKSRADRPDQASRARVPGPPRARRSRPSMADELLGEQLLEPAACEHHDVYGLRRRPRRVDVPALGARRRPIDHHRRRAARSARAPASSARARLARAARATRALPTLPSDAAIEPAHLGPRVALPRREQRVLDRPRRARARARWPRCAASSRSPSAERREQGAARTPVVLGEAARGPARRARAAAASTRAKRAAAARARRGPAGRWRARRASERRRRPSRSTRASRSRALGVKPGSRTASSKGRRGTGAGACAGQARRRKARVEAMAVDPGSLSDLDVQALLAVYGGRTARGACRWWRRRSSARGGPPPCSCRCSRGRARAASRRCSRSASLCRRRSCGLSRLRSAASGRGSRSACRPHRRARTTRRSRAVTPRAASASRRSSRWRSRPPGRTRRAGPAPSVLAGGRAGGARRALARVPWRALPERRARGRAAGHAGGRRCGRALRAWTRAPSGISRMAGSIVVSSADVSRSPFLRFAMPCIAPWVSA